MCKRRALTRIGVLVIIIVVLMALIGGPALMMALKTRARKQARSVACQNKLKMWGVGFAMYSDDNEGYFFSGEGRDNGYWWLDPLRPYYRDYKMFHCPTATKPYTEGGQNPFGAWVVDDASGSYAPNGWICNPQQGKTELWGRGPVENYWRTLRTIRVRGLNDIPLFLEAMWFEAWPRQTDEPPPNEDWLKDKVNQSEMKANQNEMRRFCVNRHDGFVNVVFMDYHVQKVGLKELWTLKWHQEYDTAGPWTKAGGVKPSDWPEWMRRFKDY